MPEPVIRAPPQSPYIWAHVLGNEPYPGKILQSPPVGRQPLPNKLYVQLYNDYGKIRLLPAKRVFDYLQYRARFLPRASADAQEAASLLEEEAGFTPAPTSFIIWASEPPSLQGEEGGSMEA